MACEWFKLSLVNGALSATSRPNKSKPLDWTERDAENLVALNPSLLEVEDLLPLRLRGTRKTVTSPDQAYVDELGRLAVVEFKKIRASLPVIAQVAAYANHWQSIPIVEAYRGLLEFARPKERAGYFGTALHELRRWHDSRLKGDLTAEDATDLGEAVLKKLSPGWTERAENFVQRIGTKHSLSHVGAPPRMIVVAPDFSEEAKDFAEQLSERMVPIELVKLEIVQSGGEIFVGRAFVYRDESSEPTWKFFRKAWELEIVNRHFLLNGWADQLNRESFSLSVRDCPDARFWIEATPGRAYIFTVVPDNWFKNDPARKDLRTRLLTELHIDDSADRWLEWEFKLPKESKKALDQVQAVAKAVVNVLRAGAPRDRLIEVPAVRDQREEF